MKLFKFKNPFLYLNILMLATMLITLYQAFILKTETTVYVLIIVCIIVCSMYSYKLSKLDIKEQKSFKLSKLDKPFFRISSYIAFFIYIFLFMLVANTRVIEISPLMFAFYLGFNFTSAFAINFFNEDELVAFSKEYPYSECQYIRVNEKKHNELVKVSFFYKNEKLDTAFELTKEEYEKIKGMQNFKNKLRY